MPDFKSHVRRGMFQPNLSGEREAHVVEELAAQLEDIYDGELALGAAPEEALRTALQALPRDPAGWRVIEKAASKADAANFRPFASGADTGRGSSREGIVHRLRVTARRLVRDRGFTSAAVATLAVAIGVNSVVFTIVHSVLLAPLPFPDSGRVMLLADQSPKTGSKNAIRTSIPEYYDRLTHLSSFESQAMFRWTDRALDTGDATGDATGSSVLRARGSIGTASLLPLVGVPPLYGRLFKEGEDEAGNERKIILSYELWQELYAGDAAAVGKQIRVDRRPYEIVGIMPKGFGIFRLDERFWIPFVYTPAQRADSMRDSQDQYHIGRLKPGVTREQARTELDALNAANFERFPEFRESWQRSGFYVSVDPLQDVMTRAISKTLYLLCGGAGFVLLIGVANLVNLALVRSQGQMKDWMTRVALGARWVDLGKLMLAEGLLLGAAAGLSGLALGAVLLRVLETTGLGQIPRASHIQLDLTAILVTVGTAVSASVLMSLIPIVLLYRVKLSEAFHESRTRTAGVGAKLTRRGLVVIQVAFAFVLLIGGGLMLISFRNLLSSKPGFDAEGVLTARFNLPPAQYGDTAALLRFTETALARIRRSPGVVAAGVTSLLPFSQTEASATPWPLDAASRANLKIRPTWFSVVSAGYLEALRVPLIKGRMFDQRDMDDAVEAPQVAIVDEVLAARYWPGRDPIGQRIFLGTNPDPTARPMFTVVGVVGAIRQNDLTTSNRRSPGTIYRPHSQAPTARQAYWVVVRTGRDPASVIPSLRSVFRSLDPELPLYEVEPLRELTELSLASRSLALSLAMAFSLTAVLLAAIGIYGVLAYVVSQRRREFGIRLALGSTGRALMYLVLREGIGLVAGGLAIGIVAAYRLRDLLAEQVFGVKPTDPWIFGAVAGSILAIALIACLSPALRATRVDPISILNDE